MGFWLVIGFIARLQIETASNYNALATSCTRLLTTAHTKASRFVFTSCFLVTDPNTVLFLCPYWLANVPQLTEFRSKSKLCYDQRSFGQSALEYSTHLGLKTSFYYCQAVSGLLMWGALSDERMGLSFARVTVSSNKPVVSMYNLHFTCY
jgi:hypothetical protein